MYVPSDFSRRRPCEVGSVALQKAVLFMDNPQNNVLSEEGVTVPRTSYLLVMLTSARPKIGEQCLPPPVTLNGVEQGEVDCHP